MTLPFEFIAPTGFPTPLFSEKAHLSVPAGTEASSPVFLKYRPSSPSSFSFQVEVGAGARFTVIEEIRSALPPAFSCSRTIRLGKGAHVEWIVLQNAGPDAVLSDFFHVIAEACSGFFLRVFSLGGADVRHEAVLEACGADVELFSSLTASLRGQQRLNGKHDHIYSAPRGKGEARMKGVVTECSKASFHGLLKIGPHGGGTATHLRQDTLNLSPAASIQATPALEIATNDVKAGHSASVRNFSDADLFYLVSRGISREEARSLLVHGFLKEDLIPLAAFPEQKQWLDHLLFS